jgi:hypothetical protein
VARPGALPTRVVRDLLGIARVLYRTATTDAERAELAEVGRLLKLALELAKPGPGTLGNDAAWGWAEQAATRLGAFIARGAQIEPAVEAVAARLRMRR